MDSRTTPCRYWKPHKHGGCRDGDGCKYAHLPPSSYPCKYFASGHCKDGEHCRYLHGHAGAKPASCPVAGAPLHGAAPGGYASGAHAMPPGGAPPPYPAGHGGVAHPAPAAPHAGPAVGAAVAGGGATLPTGNSLVVRVKNATGLRDTDGMFAGKSDPYVVLRIVDSAGRTVAGPKETSVKQDTCEPVWNEDVVFAGLDKPAAYTLRANVFDKDTFLGTGHLDWLSKDDALGSGEVDLGTLYRRTEFQDMELTVERRKLGLFRAKLNIGLSTLGGWGN